MNGQLPCPSAGVSQKHPSGRFPEDPQGQRSGWPRESWFNNLLLSSCRLPSLYTSLLTPGSPAPDPLSAAAFGGTQPEQSDGKCQHLWAYRLF